MCLIITVLLYLIISVLMSLQNQALVIDEELHNMLKLACCRNAM